MRLRIALGAELCLLVLGAIQVIVGIAGRQVSAGDWGLTAAARRVCVRGRRIAVLWVLAANIAAKTALRPVLSAHH